MAKMNFRGAKKPAAFDSMDKPIKVLLIVALAILLGFTFVYIYNIHNQQQRMEGFMGMGTIQEEAKANVDFKVVYVYSSTCPYCQDFTPVFNEYVSKERRAGIHFASFEKDEPMASKYLSSVTAYPTVVITNNEDVVLKTQVGSTNYQDLKTFVETHTSMNMMA